MKKRNASFIELILVLFFFMLAALVIVQLFSKAYLIQQETRTSSLATLYMEELLERFRHDPRSIQTGTIYFDQDLTVVPHGEYELKIVVDEKDALYEIELSFYANNERSIHFESAVYERRAS